MWLKLPLLLEWYTSPLLLCLLESKSGCVCVHTCTHYIYTYITIEINNAIIPPLCVAPSCTHWAVYAHSHPWPAQRLQPCAKVLLKQLSVPWLNFSMQLPTAVSSIPQAAYPWPLMAPSLGKSAPSSQWAWEFSSCATAPWSLKLQFFQLCPPAPTEWESLAKRPWCHQDSGGILLPEPTLLPHTTQNIHVKCLPHARKLCTQGFLCNLVPQRFPGNSFSQVLKTLESHFWLKFFLVESQEN